ncbi:peptide-N-glycosidase F-related protein [Maribellus mangrovi]|uniref:peptide-N-glycosidase F-related protein n=1 Tax=Maribellus mangrovi TaxID=3133146 RepID=UPI0030EB8C57
MKKITLFIIAIFALQAAFAQTKVTTHDELMINTDPSQGVKSFIKWGVFPSPDKEVRRIVMNLTLAYPKDRAIAHWDYMDRVKILRQGGVNGKNINFEIGRMLTPYGSNFKEGWSYTWSVDVTDFQAFLRDSVEIEYIHSGYESPDLGWDLTIDFDITFGPQVADFISVKEMWNGSFQYGNQENPIEKQLAPMNVTTADGATFGRFRIQHTGHGMDRPSGCSEFCSRWRELVFDGEVVDHRDMWKECGDNPLYPQGGTWIFDRAYWCPGDLQIPDVIDVPLTKKKHTIDLDMEPFTANNIDQPREQITSYFFQFADPNNTNDVRIEEIIAPNKKDNYNRFNPRGFSPIIQVRNLGKETLTSLDIVYKTVGFGEKHFKWEGNLGFYEAAIITLPGEIDSNNGENTFSVTMNNPNGVEDQWDGDNNMEVQFESIPTIPSDIVVELMTNNRPKDNWLHIVNSDYDTLYAKTPEMLDTASTYIDTLHLAEGNYFLNLVDTAGDGLEFWFMANAGYGRLRMKDLNGHIIHLFESDCGSGQFYAFKADSEAKVDTTIPYFAANIYPRMIKDFATLYTTTNKPSTIKVRITKDGEWMETHEFANLKDAQTGLDLSHLEEGRYVMEIYLNGKHQMNRRFNKVPPGGFRY